ncbi:hypothetical protein AB0D14_27185 [Streptomyces sp. NPDC048484]|uniref:hypothetical protein n=1 Tax=Streptomyces sp. NPDC048484 TaxID=3155146 RepID=UPI00343A7E9B
MTVHVAESTITVELDGQVRVVQRPTDVPVRDHQIADYVDGQIKKAKWTPGGLSGS